MTESRERVGPLPVPVSDFVLQWGELGGQWGVNRSIGQIHALMYATPRPMAAEEVAEILGMARSNVSNSIKELVSWGLVRKVPIPSDRRDFFEAESDVFEIARRIAAGRKAREVDPALKILADCSRRAAEDPEVEPATARRIEAMRKFTSAASTWYDQIADLPSGKVTGLMRLGAKVASLLPGGRR